MSMRYLLGYDYGASSGRAMLGRFDGERLAIEELHRFSNDPVQVGPTLYWDTLRLFHEMKNGLLAAVKAGIQPDAIGIDTWGVDFGLLDRKGQLLGNPVHYRDARTDPMMDKAFAIMPKAEIFAQTGLAFLPFNTLYQILALMDAEDPALDIADTLLFTPDLLAYFLTGEKATEYTIASTGQLIDPQARNWSETVIDGFSLPRRLFTEIQQPGMRRGDITASLARELGLTGVTPVMAIGSHDTASAVASVPAQGDRFAYISSGTWSLLGVELPHPVLTPGVLDANYTNEGGVLDTTRVLKNIMGLWILQECRREWQRRGEAEDFAELVSLAEKADPFIAYFDPDDAQYMAPGDMPGRIQRALKASGQRVPQTHGEIARVIYENLALKYRWSLRRLEKDILGYTLECLHIVGGGSKNALLNRFTASAIDKPVIAGPSEGTAIGNLLMQAYALGELSGLSDMRAVVRASFETETFMPENPAAWDDAYGAFLHKTGLTD